MSNDAVLNDYGRVLKMLRHMGFHGMERMPGLTKMPGFSSAIAGDEQFSNVIDRIERMIDLMTDDERRDPSRIGVERQARIAASAAVPPPDVEKFLSEFGTNREFLHELQRMSLWQRIKAVYGIRFP